MAVLTVQEVNRNGFDLLGSIVAADVAGDSWPNTGTEFLYVDNQHGSTPCTVGLDIQLSVDGQTVPDKTVVVAAGAKKLIGPFPTATYNDGNSRAKVTYTSVASVKVAALKLGST